MISEAEASEAKQAEKGKTTRQTGRTPYIIAKDTA
jgi:hypothetical protein